jgi:tRNA-specific 2-thiouridylase
MARVAVLMSGGIDSAGAALLLKTQGHKVAGISGRFWEAVGTHSEGIAAARETCRVLGVPHTVVDLRSEFRLDVLDPFISGYLEGETPNPCACCNRDIKLGRLAASVKDGGFEFVATGHYARIGEVGGRVTLCEPADRHKSQVYFLSLVKPDVLGFLMLPLGDYRKEEVRRLLEDAGIPAEARDSQDLCFAAGGRYHDLLRLEGYVPSRGDVLDGGGNVIGTHKGHAAYTLGQRFGLRGKRYYVIEKHPETNTIVIGEREEALRSEITATGINLFLPLPPEGSGTLSIRYRYNSPPVGARITVARKDRITVVTEEPCFAPAPGQVLAGYMNGCLVFGGIIERLQVSGLR